ncbi:MAG: hypothetical protein KAS23_02960 [Anaerohalosphaera sp.]|nr:hypothetical protein [Anaerohalosphaera sp.]
MHRNLFIGIGAVLVVLAFGAAAFMVPTLGNEKNDSSKALVQTDDFLSGPAEIEVGLVPLAIELPRAVYGGTPPITFKVPGGKIIKPSDKLREPFLVPVGVFNVAAGKPVSASDEFPVVGEIEMVTDGDKEGADGSYVDLGPFLQFVTIDLERKYEIYAIVMWHFHKEPPRAYVDVVVQVADDADFTQNVRTLYNNDHDNTAGLGVGGDWHYVESCEGKLIDAKGTKARYVRAYSDGNSSDDSTHFIEIEVFGK